MQCGKTVWRMPNFSALITRSSLDLRRIKCTTTLCELVVRANFVMNDVMGMDEPFNYRNKSQFPVGMDKEGNIISGFMQEELILL